MNVESVLQADIRNTKLLWEKLQYTDACVRNSFNESNSDFKTAIREPVR
jgi:hypothetical protein